MLIAYGYNSGWCLTLVRICFESSKLSIRFSMGFPYQGSVREGDAFVHYLNWFTVSISRIQNLCIRHLKCLVVDISIVNGFSANKHH